MGNDPNDIVVGSVYTHRRLLRMYNNLTYGSEYRHDKHYRSRSVIT